MNSRAILKKIRPFKTRTNRIVTQMHAGFSFQSSAKPGWISRAMKYSSHFYEIRFDTEKDPIFVKYFDRSSANRFAPEWKSFRVFQYPLDGSVDFGLKPVSQPRLAFIVPDDSVFKFKPRLKVEDYLAAHFRLLSLSGSSARIRSHGMPFSGLRLNRSARRSASSICSGDKPSSKSPNSSRIWSATSRRSFSGKWRICSKISVALTSINYRDVLKLQADIYSRSSSLSVLSNRFENNLATHFQPNRCFISALTFSQGIPSCGLASNSATRRSSSAACSGERSGSCSSSPMISQKSCASLILSSCGRAFAASSISVALMSVIYREGLELQADNGAPKPRLTMGRLRSGEQTRLACRGRRPRRPLLRVFYTSCRTNGISRRGRRLPHARARVLPGTDNGHFSQGFRCARANSFFHPLP